MLQPWTHLQQEPVAQGSQQAAQYVLETGGSGRLRRCTLRTLHIAAATAVPECCSGRPTGVQPRQHSVAAAAWSKPHEQSQSCSLRTPSSWGKHPQQHSLVRSGES
jgi:hypothetical protein